jgi:BASS family bile acid:Na+ symporter
MAIQPLIGPVVTVSLIALIAALGMNATFGELVSLFRQPVRLLKALIAVNVVAPTAAAIIIGLFPLTPLVQLGIVVMAVSPVPPFVPGKALKAGGDKSYTLGLYTALSLLAVIIVPVTVAILSKAYGVDVPLPPLAVLRIVVISVILPLAIGLGVRRFWPALAELLAPVLGKLAMLVLLIVVVLLLIVLWPRIMGLIGNGTVVAMALVSAIALAAGHLLGGPSLGDRGALAVSAATRHPGIALTIANAAGHREATPAIIAFVLVSCLVTIPYQMWMKRRIAARASYP